MRKAIVDIGTNTMLLLIAEYSSETKSITTLEDIQRIPRLGKGVDNHRHISLDTIHTASNILNEYKKIAEKYNINKITATATSFLRDAANKNEFVSEVHKNTGINIELLSGDDEAKWTFIGGTYDFIRENPGNEYSIIDIGGGSTEITSGSISLETDLKRDDYKKFNIKGQSLNIGSVRIKERYLSKQPPDLKNLKDAEDFIIQKLSKSNIIKTKSDLIGVAGTITTLAAMKLKLDKYESNKVDGIKLSLYDIQDLFNIICSMSTDDLLKLGNYMEGRQDIILSGVLILKTFMKYFNYNEITVSTKGLRYGIFLREVLHSSDELTS